MRKVKWDAFLSGICGFAVALGVVAAGARADVTTEKGASILVFPKVQADGTYDTVIQLANTGNSMVHAHCFYVDATPAGTWQETDFWIWLTKQQPTHWLVSSGRRVDPLDGFFNDGSGFDPGHVPPMSDFEGELKCVEVTESGEPMIGNHLKGEATIKVVVEQKGDGIGDPGATYGDVSKYNAIGIRGNAEAAAANPLLLDGQMYDACPAKLIVDHFATGAESPVVGRYGFGGQKSVVNGDANNVHLWSSVSTELTLVPCTEDFENQTAKSVTLQFLIYNELEQRFSASTTVNCYLSTELTKIDSPTAPERSAFSRPVLGTDVAHTEITPVVQPDGTTGGVIGVVERVVSVSGTTDTVSARAAYNLHTAGDLIPDDEALRDRITLPLWEAE